MKWKCEKCKYYIEVKTAEQVKAALEILPVKINSFYNPQCTICTRELIIAEDE